MRILVTGATGFIGSRVVARLVECEHTVVGLTRSPEGAAKLEAAGALGLVADLREAGPTLESLVKRVMPEVVFHLAAEIATQRSAKKLWEVDVGGTERLVAACVAAKERTGFPLRILYAGTVVVGDAHGALLQPDVPLAGATVYGRAKLEAERLCLAAAQHGIGVTVLRPSHVYGAGGWFAEIVRDMRKGKFYVPGHGENWWDLVHVDDVADAFVRALDAGESAVGEIFHVVDDTPLHMREFFDAVSEVLEVRRPGSVPVWLAKLVRGGGPIDAAVRSAKSSNTKLKSRLGWHPRWPDARAALPSVVAAIEL